VRPNIGRPQRHPLVVNDRGGRPVLNVVGEDLDQQLIRVAANDIRGVGVAGHGDQDVAGPFGIAPARESTAGLNPQRGVRPDGQHGLGRLQAFGAIDSLVQGGAQRRRQRPRGLPIGPQQLLDGRPPFAVDQVLRFGADCRSLMTLRAQKHGGFVAPRGGRATQARSEALESGLGSAGAALSHYPIEPIESLLALCGRSDVLQADKEQV